MTEGIVEQPAPERQWSRSRLQDMCRRMRAGVESRQLCSEAELDALDPGDDATYNELIHYYAQLTARRTWEKFLTHGSEYASRHLLKALDSEPEEVALVSGDTVTVHPKSEAALRWFRDNYHWLNWFNVRNEALYQQSDEYEERKENGGQPLNGVSEPISTTARITAETNYYVALVMWAACHEGPGLPWGYASGPPDPEKVPSYWYDLHTLDVSRIERALYEVNAGRLRFLPKPQERGKGVTPEQFFSQRTQQTGTPVPELRRGRDLASQVAEVILAGHRED